MEIKLSVSYFINYSQVTMTTNEILTRGDKGHFTKCQFWVIEIIIGAFEKKILLEQKRFTL